MTPLPFIDREDAGRRLGLVLAKYRGQRPLVLAIPRGAVPMARVIADALEGDLDVVLVRKLRAPGNPELAIGAVDEQRQVHLAEGAACVDVDDAYLAGEVAAQMRRLEEQRRRFGRGRPPRPVEGRVVIVVDDGLATGATMAAALRAVRAGRPRRLVCAVPVGSPAAVRQAAALADEVVCLATPSPFRAVGLYYLGFDQVTDEEVERALARRDPDEAVVQREVRIPAGDVLLPADLDMPPDPRGLVIFAHGSGSSRHSTRNRAVAAVLQRRGIATLLLDLLTVDEDADVASRFDIALLARRLRAAIDWARADRDTAQLPLGLFGASTGAAAAVVAAAQPGAAIAAVVSRGGRPDLAGTALDSLRTPTLLLVGGADSHVLELNREARRRIGANATLEVIPRATHLFEEPGALGQVADHAADWFERHLGREHGRVQQAG